MSSNISLLPGEQIVTSSDKNVLVLTTKRVRFDTRGTGRSNLVSITLDAVASCGLATSSSPMLLVIAAIALLAAFTQRGNAVTALIVVAVVFVIAYFATRKSVLSIASNGGQSIRVPTIGMSRDMVIGFIEAVEREKLK